jgi:hypothetical protein
MCARSFFVALRRCRKFNNAPQIKAGEGLIVVAPFLPSPLIELLGGEGFTSKLERGSGSDWLVYFWRECA